jgi:hypothetical protein
MTVKVWTPSFAEPLTDTTTVRALPVSRVTRVLTPPTLLITRGRPLKPEPMMVIVVVLPAMIEPATRVALKGRTNVTFAAGEDVAM